jgi:hypothetical protein
LRRLPARRFLRLQTVTRITGVTYDGAKTHPCGKLHAQVAQPADPQDGTGSPGLAPLLRSALNAVTPAHISGPASLAGSSSGIRASGSHRPRSR